MQKKIMAVIRCESRVLLPKIAGALIAGGVKVLEVTMTVPDAIWGLGEIVSQFGDKALIGAGTVLDADACRDSIDAGASFVVSPCFNPAVIRAAIERDVLAIPGCLTPTEVSAALREGTKIVKIFPASVVGPNFLKEMAGPFPGLKMMPTGGINLDNAREFLDAGAAALGIGGNLVDRQALKEGNFEKLTENAKRFVSIVSEYTCSRACD